jgi:hypothetical protein
MSTQVFQREAIEERVSIKGDSEAAGALPRFSMCRLTAVMSTQCAKKKKKQRRRVERNGTITRPKLREPLKTIKNGTKLREEV